jgi:hypothetical protein
VSEIGVHKSAGLMETVHDDGAPEGKGLATPSNGLAQPIAVPPRRRPSVSGVTLSDSDPEFDLLWGFQKLEADIQQRRQLPK